MITVKKMQGILDNKFVKKTKNKIYSHWLKKEEIDNVEQNEFIIFTPHGFSFSRFASNKPIIYVDNVDIKYYAKKDCYNSDNVAKIIKLMLANGFFYSGTLIPVYSSETPDIVGALLEFTESGAINGY